MGKVINFNDIKKDEKSSTQKLTRDEEIDLLNMLEKDNLEDEEYNEFWDM